MRLFDQVLLRIVCITPIDRGRRHIFVERMPCPDHHGFQITARFFILRTKRNPKFLKEKYGKKFVFWGGGVDTQKTLPFGTAAECREQCRERIDIFSEDGGYVFNTIHNIQANTPVENILAIYREAVKK